MGYQELLQDLNLFDVLQGIAMIMRQLHEGRAEIEIAYKRGVEAQGNPIALAAIDEVFETVDTTWRGLGLIPQSGYAIREKYKNFDAFKRFQPEVEPTQEPKGCRCGDVLRGAMLLTNVPYSAEFVRQKTPLDLAWFPRRVPVLHISAICRTRL